MKQTEATTKTESRKMRKPIHTIKAGRGIRLPIYAYVYKVRGKAVKQYRFSVTSNGKTKHVTATDFDRIKELAIEQAESIRDNKPETVMPSVAVPALEQAIAILGDAKHLIAACHYYKENVLNLTQQVTVAESFELYREEKRPSISHGRYVYLAKVQRHFEQDAMVSSIDSALIDSIIRKLTGSPRTKRELYIGIAAWLRWAEKKGHCANAEQTLNRVTVKGEKSEGKQETFSAEELSRLMQAASPEVLPVFALCAFGGLRKAEAIRIRWQDINLTDGKLSLPREIVKTNARRAFDITPTLAAWLQSIPSEQRNGQVWKGTKGQWDYAQQQTATKASVDWKDNAFRHTFISARYALGADENIIAREAGNSTAIIRKHYLALISKAEGQSWFDVMPNS